MQVIDDSLYIMIFYTFLTCLVTVGAVRIQDTLGAVDFAGSDFSQNEALTLAGRIISLDKNNIS